MGLLGDLESVVKYFAAAIDGSGLSGLGRDLDALIDRVVKERKALEDAVGRTSWSGAAADAFRARAARRQAELGSMIADLEAARQAVAAAFAVGGIF